MFISLPMEIVFKILSYLDLDTINQVLFIHPILKHNYNDNTLWHSICLVNHIKYKLPSITWKELVLSREMFKLCPHINLSLFKLLSHKQMHTFSNCHHDNNCQYICFHPKCNFIDNDHHQLNNHFNKFNHPIHLKMSFFSLFELQCFLCDKQLGVDSRMPSEKYVVQKIIQKFVTPINSTNNEYLIKYRRKMETSLFNRPSLNYIIKKSWYDTWLTFLRGGSSIPTKLNNHTLLLENGDLDPSLEIGVDFELINNATRYYIEYIYGLKGRFISKFDLQNDPRYCRLIHQIHLHQQRQRRLSDNIRFVTIN